MNPYDTFVIDGEVELRVSEERSRADKRVIRRVGLHRYAKTRCDMCRMLPRN